VSVGTQFPRGRYNVLGREWPVLAALVVVSLLSLVLVGRIVHLPGMSPAGTRALVIGTGALLTVAIMAASVSSRTRIVRAAQVIFASLATLFLIDSVGELVSSLPKLKTSAAGLFLLRDAAIVFAIDIILFAVWFWMIDAAGAGIASKRRDFLFAQEVMKLPGWEDWHPDFSFYVFMSFYNSVTFGPTDTYVLSRRGRILIVLQVIISLVVVLTFLARAFVIIK
jgi:hypothetical protein